MKNKKDNTNSNSNSNLNLNNNKEKIEKNLDTLKIKIINHVLKKNLSGKPYLDYVCEIKNVDKTHKLHKKLNNFYTFHKSLKEYFKDKINIPDHDNVFIEDNIKNGFLENKQDLLNNYIEGILKINEIKQSLIFQNFFEIK